MKYAVLFFALPVIFFSCKDQQEKIIPAETRLTESVYASVTIQPDSLNQVYSAVGGILDINLVEEVNKVKKGNALLQIIKSTPKLSAENARLALQLSKENYHGDAAVLKGMEDEMLTAILTLKNDSINFMRQQNLWNQKVGSKVEYDNRKLVYEVSKNQLRLL